MYFVGLKRSSLNTGDLKDRLDFALPHFVPLKRGKAYHNLYTCQECLFYVLMFLIIALEAKRGGNSKQCKLKNK